MDADTHKFPGLQVGWRRWGAQESPRPGSGRLMARRERGEEGQVPVQGLQLPSPGTLRGQAGLAWALVSVTFSPQGQCRDGQV